MPIDLTFIAEWAESSCAFVCLKFQVSVLGGGMSPFSPPSLFLKPAPRAGPKGPISCFLLLFTMVSSLWLRQISSHFWKIKLSRFLPLPQHPPFAPSFALGLPVPVRLFVTTRFLKGLFIVSVAFPAFFRRGPQVQRVLGKPRS